MNKLEKTAFIELKKRFANFEKEKDNIFASLMQEKEFLHLHRKETELLIEHSKDYSNLLLKQEFEKATQEKLAYLRKTGYENVLKNEHFCSKCKDSGFVKGKHCQCFKKVLSELALKQSGLNINLQEYEKTDFSIFSNSERIKKLYDLTAKWLEKFETSNIRNWAFMGHTGTGKTYLMLHLAKKLMDKGVYVYFTTAHALATDLTKEYAADKDEYGEYLAKYIDCDVLFIDDLGTEINQKKVTNQLLHTLFNERMLANKPVIFSTNFDMDELENFYGERIFSRLINKRTTKSVWFDDGDLRLTKKKD